MKLEASYGNFIYCFAVHQMFSIISAGTTEKPSGNQDAINRLRQDLLRYYDRYAQPSPEEKVTNVNITLKIRNVDLDYKSSVFSANGWITMEWVDESLIWKPEEYHGIKTVNIANHEIWKPDVVAYNSISADVFDSYENTNFIVGSSGRVQWSPPSSFKVFCSIDLTHWPYDTQECSLILNSLSYDGSSINLQIKNHEEEILLENSTYGWQIISVNPQRREVYYQCCPEPFVTLEYSFTVQKAHHLYHCFIILPAVAVALLLLSAFWLPPDVPEKFTLIVTVGLLCTLFLTFFAAKIPVLLHQTPNIIKYYAYMFCSTLFYFVISMLLFNVSTGSIYSARPFPRNVERFVNTYCSLFVVFSTKHKTIMETDTNDLDEISIHRDENPPNDGQTSCNQWYQLMVLVDRILFLFYSIFISVMITRLVLLL